VIGGLLKGIAKGIIFAKANPEAAIQIHWQVFPESKSTEMTEADVLTEAALILTYCLRRVQKEGGK
jgi:NitT/TauT family transport system substrate-binding protein